MSEASRERLWNILYPNKPYKPKGSPVPDPNLNPNDTITFTELSDALCRLGYADFTTKQHARLIYNDIKEHREPEWKAGDIVKSKSNTIYTRLAGSYWMNESTGVTVADTYPQRPLTLIGRMI